MNNILQMVNELIDIPKDFENSFIKEVSIDDNPVTWVRYKKRGAIDYLGGEHFSVLLDPNNKLLKAMIHLENGFVLDSNAMPTEEESEKIAFDFLKSHAPDLIYSVEIKWIKPLQETSICPPHDEGFKMASGNTITGMRVKLLIHSNNKFGWVIIGKNNKVISFESDVIWDAANRCRKTEKWLHDSWLEQNNISLSTEESSIAV